MEKRKQVDFFSEVLIDEASIKAKVKELAARINEEYKGKTVVLICILRGAFVFFADLIRELTIDVELDFMAISSYGSGSESSGMIKITKDISSSVQDKDVIIVEDIIDSGNTILHLKKLFEVKDVRSLKTCILLDKPERREVEVEGDYIGFKIPNEFVVGYGLDYDERFRNLKDIRILKPEMYK